MFLFFMYIIEVENGLPKQKIVRDHWYIIGMHYLEDA